MQDELVLVTSAGNRALGRDGMCAADLTSVPLVIRETGSGTLDVVERALAAKGLSLRSLNIEMQLGSTESIKHYLYDSGAAAFLSVQAIREELPSWIAARNRSVRLVRYALFQLRFPAWPPQSSGRFVRALLRPSYPFGKLTPRSCRAWDSDKAFAGDLGSMSGKILSGP